MIRTLAQSIVRLAPTFEAHAFAPSTFAELMQARAQSRGLVRVWEGASEATIFRDARTNHAFRAWHDETHARHSFAFTLEGERATCEAQCAQLLRELGSSAWPLAQIIRCEVIGQAEYFAATGTFPQNQLTFARAWLKAHNVNLEE